MAVLEERGHVQIAAPALTKNPKFTEEILGQLEAGVKRGDLIEIPTIPKTLRTFQVTQKENK